jgi:hypothetical protein
MLFSSLLKSLHYIARMLCSNANPLSHACSRYIFHYQKETPPNADPKPMPCCIPYVMMPPNSI